MACKGAGKKGPNGSGPWYLEKGADEWTSGKIDDGGGKVGKKGSKGSKPDGYGYKDKGSNGSKGKDKTKGKGKSETRYCYECGEQGHIGVNCPYKWTDSIDAPRGRVSLKEKRQKNLRVWRRPMTKESGAGLGETGSLDGTGELIHNSRTRREDRATRGTTVLTYQASRISVAVRSCARLTGKAGENGQYSAEWAAAWTRPLTPGCGDTSLGGDQGNIAPGSLPTGSPAGRTLLLLKRGDGPIYSQAYVRAASCCGSSIAFRDRGH